MEAAVSTTRERKAEKDRTQGADQDVSMSSKPLYRFTQKEPRSLGIVIVIFGCAELLMGFQLASQDMRSSYDIYIPFWLGALFLCSGILSIYTELHPSKKMVTVSLAMYVVSMLGILVSIGYRIFCLADYQRYTYHYSYHYSYEDRFSDRTWLSNRTQQILVTEAVLLASSVLVFGLLIFLSIIARFALKSTHTQIIVQHILTPVNNIASN